MQIYRIYVTKCSACAHFYKQQCKTRAPSYNTMPTKKSLSTYGIFSKNVAYSKAKEHLYGTHPSTWTISFLRVGHLSFPSLYLHI